VQTAKLEPGTACETHGKKREAVTRLLSDDEVNPTLDTLIELLSALQLTADITLRQAREGEGSIRVATEL